GGDRYADEPQIALPTPEQETRRKALQEALDRLTASFRAESPARSAAQARWEQSVIAAEHAWIVVPVDRFQSTGGSSYQRLDDTRDPVDRVRRQAVFVPARPFATAGAPLRISIKTAAPIGQALGRFRVSVTAGPSPLRVVGVPARLRPALVTPRAKRTPQQAK